MNKNQNLYFYGLGARLLQGMGILIIIISLFGGSLIFFLVGLVIGIATILYGKSLRFDYQRRSGSIIHQGDWK